MVATKRLVTATATATTNAVRCNPSHHAHECARASPSIIIIISDSFPEIVSIHNKQASKQTLFAVGIYLSFRRHYLLVRPT